MIIGNDCELYNSKHWKGREESCESFVERELAGAQVAGYFSHINSML